MSKLDQFESAFKSASKAQYAHREVTVRSAMLLTDLKGEPARRFASDLRGFLPVLDAEQDVAWSDHSIEVDHDAARLLELIEDARPDLICSYRNVRGPARDFPFSLGAYVDVLCQATTTPVLLVPAPDEDGRLSAGCRNTEHVMVLTDALTGNDALVHWGARLVEPAGTLVLAHLEDDATFQRYIDTIGKIPSIDTEVAEETLALQLLKEPRDYARSCELGLASSRPKLTVRTAVEMGHRIVDCRRLIEQFEIDLVVLNTKDQDQLAMHGLAYPLAVELRDVPLLML
ncbi:MAG: hypothetical protein JRI23_00880 [Deltaproteobacteria bacterium]|nr:hypothetical protein [Deltaproteobacteria bacterium]MBW2530007.1 hypothetical protein [Deltaproteobacteria bacterium]